MKNDPATLVQALRVGDARALARVISLIEDEASIAAKCVELIFPFTGVSQVIGVTGAPGAGKSTLVNELVNHLVGVGKRVAVVAVDPSSPFSGGAVLGDRIRMAQASERDGVFIRSMANRGALGGVAPKTNEVIFALEAARFDYVIVETVGVGQGEVEIVRMCDTCLVVLVPGMGDSVQALKAGVLEIADLFVINKADRSEANQLKQEIVSMLGLANTTARQPEIIMTTATKGEGIGELASAIARYYDWAKDQGRVAERRRVLLREAVYREISGRSLKLVLERATTDNLLERALDEVYSRHKSPRAVAEGLIELVRR